MFPFLDGVPFITVMTIGENHLQSAIAGNVQHPAYVPTPLWDYPRPWNIFNKIYNVGAHIIYGLIYRRWIVPAVEYEVKVVTAN